MAERNKYVLNNNDYRLFKAYFEDLQCHTGFSQYKLLKGANLPLTYYQDIKQFLNGNRTWRKTINILIFLHLGSIYSYPLDVSKYTHLLEPHNKDTEKV